VIAGYDVAVIGAGLVGCASALQLARRGLRVVAVDQGELNRGASGRNAGSLHFQLEPRMLADLAIEPRRLAELLPVNLQAIEDWRRLQQELRCDLELVMHGGLMVAESEADRALLIRKIELETAAGLSVRMVEGAELRRMAPYLAPSVRCASYCPDEGHANPRFVTPAYAAAARERGATFELGLRVSALEPRAEGWRVVLRPAVERGRARACRTMAINAHKLLIAAGAWSREILQPLGVNLPLRSVGLSMNVTERCGPLIGHLIQHVGRRLSLKQVAAGNVLIGGGWRALLPEGTELGPDPIARLHEPSVIGNAAVALHTVPALGTLNLIRSWTGIAPVSPDHLPILGEIESLPGVFIATAGSSFTLGPTYARLISELICEEAASLPIGLYRPGRMLGH
jgi:sarcosine oxidase, subunit beta